jgi:flavin reductase (DIM6/NTAB) family NADH-FMN oxidoreductase RutF
MTRPRAASQLDPVRLRRALGRFVSGVTVVTTAGADDDRQVHGMTANAFTSVSLRPPLVLVSIANQANLQSRLLATGRYGVSVLTDEQASLAQHFSGRQAHPDQVRFVWRDGLPLIDDALVQLTCTVVAAHPAGDHTLHVARVDTLAELTGEPLVYHRSQLRRLG